MKELREQSMKERIIKKKRNMEKKNEATEKRKNE